MPEVPQTHIGNATIICPDGTDSEELQGLRC